MSKKGSVGNNPGGGGTATPFSWINAQEKSDKRKQSTLSFSAPVVADSNNATVVQMVAYQDFK